MLVNLAETTPQRRSPNVPYNLHSRKAKFVSFLVHEQAKHYEQTDDIR